MNITGKLVEKTSKSGNKYVCVELQLTPTYSKTVFLEKAEIALLASIQAQQK